MAEPGTGSLGVRGLAMERALNQLAVITYVERMGLLALAGVTVLAVIGTVLACQRASRSGIRLRHLPGVSITDNGGCTTIIAGLACSAAAITVTREIELPARRPVSLPAGLRSEQVTLRPVRLAAARERATAARAAVRAGTEVVEGAVDRAGPGSKLAGQV